MQLLQAKAFLALAQAELTDYDQVLALSRDRLQSGDIARIDMDRLALQRVQYESDVQTAAVNLRTAKIQLLELLNDQTTPVDQLDVVGPYDFTTSAESRRFRQPALQTVLISAALRKSEGQTDHHLAIANGSTDPTISGDVGWPVPAEARRPSICISARA